MSRIHFIGGEKGGVGKSVVARLLAQYYIDKSLPFTVVDADRSHGAMGRFYSEFTKTGDLDRFESTDHILQLALDLDQRVLVDLPAQSDRYVRKWMEQSGVIELAAEHSISLVFWHVMDGGRDSITLLDALFDTYGTSVNYCVVKNLGRGSDFSTFEASEARKKAEQHKALILTLAELHESTMHKIDTLNASFWSAANNVKNGLGMIERHRVKVWMRNAYAEFDRANV